MHRFTLITIICLLSLESDAQKFLKKLKDKISETIDNVSDENFMEEGGLVGQARNKQLKKDTSNYNYIFSQGNRASFFANREGKENIFLTAGKSLEDDNGDVISLEPYEKAFDANRAGELAMYVNRKLAHLNFAQALGALTNEPGKFRIGLDSAVALTRLANVGAMTLPERYALGKTIANYAILIHSEGRYNLSHDVLQETIRYFEEQISKNAVVFGSLCNNMGVVLQSLGRFTEAETYFNRSLQILKSKERATSVSYAIVLNNKALLYNEIGQYEKAKQTIDRAANLASGELREKGRDNTSFKINKGLILYSSGEYDEAERLFREVILLKEKRMAGNQADVGNVKNYLAATLMAKNQVEEVPALLSQALEIFKKKYSEGHPAYIKTKHNLGKYHLSSGDWDQAEQILTEVNTTYQRFFGETHPDYLASLEDLAMVAWKQNKIGLARARFSDGIKKYLSQVEKYFGAMSEYEKGQYWAKIRPSILNFYAFAVDQSAADPSLLSEVYNIHLKTKGILLSASTKVKTQILNGDDETLKRQYKEWVRRKENLLLYYSYSKTQLGELEIDLGAEEEQINALEKELNKRSSDFADANKLPTTTLAEVKAQLGGRDAAIEVIGYPVLDQNVRDKNYAFLIASLDQLHPQLVLIKEGNRLDTRYAKAYLNKVKQKLQDNLSYKKYWEPVDDALQGRDNIYLSLDGVYFQVNVGALQKPDGSFVSDAYHLHYCTSTRDLTKPQRSGQALKTATFFGYPDYGYGGRIAPLPGTRKEIASIGQITQAKGYKTQTFMQREASELNFKKMKAPSLLHLATHGFFLPEQAASGERVLGIDVTEANKNPLLRSGLMLADAEQAMQQDEIKGAEVSTTDNGILTAYEVMNMDLEDTETVVLSACETGLGEIKSGEGVYGLQRAFQVAGVETLVMSLWKVSDEATQSLMSAFYKQWMGGQQKEEAFLAAQRQLRERFPEPYYWGAFIMLN